MGYSREEAIRALADVALGPLEMGHAYNLKTQQGTGTCFLYGNSDGFFYVTARHLVSELKVHDRVFFAHEKGWIEWNIEAIFFPENEDDVAVFITDQVIGGIPEFDHKFRVMPGQPLKFLGFPHGLVGNFPSQYGFLTPLVRSANFSGVIDHKGSQLTVLDGFNNPGYSGGPVYCCGEDGSAKLFAIISSYRNETESHSRIYKKNADGLYDPVPDYMVKLNSGMIYATGKASFQKLFDSVDTFQPKPVSD